MCWRSEVEAPNLSCIGLCCRKESGFRRISFFFVRVNLFFFFFKPKKVKPQVHVGKLQAEGGALFGRGPSEAKAALAEQPWQTQD